MHLSDCWGSSSRAVRCCWAPGSSRPPPRSGPPSRSRRRPIRRSRRRAASTSPLVLDASGSVSSVQRGRRRSQRRGRRHARLAVEHQLARRGSRSSRRSPSNSPRAPWSTRRRMAPNGVLAQGGQRLLQPDTAAPVERRTSTQYNGTGNPHSSGSYTTAQQLDPVHELGPVARPGSGRPSPNLVVYVTDGDPTAFDFNHAGDPFTAAADVAVQHRSQHRGGADDARPRRRGGQPDQGATARGCWPSASARRLNNPASQNRLVADLRAAGRSRRRPRRTSTSLNEIDVALVTDFDDLAQLMRAVVLAAVLAVADDPQARADRRPTRPTQPAPGWAMTVTPTVPDRQRLPTGSCPTRRRRRRRR